MITEQEKQYIRQCMDALKCGIDGFRARRAQLEMVAVVAQTLARCRDREEGEADGSNIAVVEAGTGTGKSFGALIPALVMAHTRRKHLVVSSSTVALQHQYAEKDAPALQRLLPLGFTFAVAKGRRRYACLSKLAVEVAKAQQGDLDLGDGSPAPLADGAQVRHRAIMLALAEDFEAGRWNGDRDELAVPVVDEFWQVLTTDRQGCSGNKCAEFAHCPFYLARQQVKEADLVIANHDLVLSALAMDAGSVLPAAAETIFVFDEAHSLAAKVVEHFSARHQLRGAGEWIRGALDAVRDAVLALGLDEALLHDARASADALATALHALHARIEATRGFETKRSRRFRSGALPPWIVDLGEKIGRDAALLQKTFVAVRESILERIAVHGTLASRLLAGVGFFAGKLENLIDTWALMLADDAEHGVPIARWIERQEGEGQRGGDFLVCAAPLAGSDKLKALLWNRASSVVLMSATLTSCGSFDLFLRQSGLTSYAALQMLQVGSPFNYRDNATLFIAAMRSDPSDAPAHTREVIERLPALVNTRGTLVLFASAAQMRNVYSQLPEPLRRVTLLQGAMPKMEMLDRHRAAIDRGDSSVLFGLQSLAEGIDLPRDYCTHVVCVKLPFSTPDSPLEEARREWVESQGRSSFIEITVPETAIRFKQQLGRLLRTTEDSGTVSVLDRRLVTKRWGGLLMRGLPDFQIVVERSAKTKKVQRSAPAPP